jgi:hypothetical protein
MNFGNFNMKLVGFAGSRRYLNVGQRDNVCRIFASIIYDVYLDGGYIAVGCANGVDRDVLMNCYYRGYDRLHLHLAFDPDSAEGVRNYANSPIADKKYMDRIHVNTLPPYYDNCSIPARLHFRTVNMVNNVDFLFAAFNSIDSRGTALACSTAAKRNVPIVAYNFFNNGFPPPLVECGYDKEWVRIYDNVFTVNNKQPSLF